MLVHEFRTNMKKCLDDAVRGIPVVIERGGMEFHIIASPKGSGMVSHLGVDKGGPDGDLVSAISAPTKTHQTSNPTQPKHKTYFKKGQK